MLVADPASEPTMRAGLLATALCLALAACQSAGPPPAPSPEQAPTGVTPNTFRMPTGSGCGGEIERFQAVIDNDVQTGHTTRNVHVRVSAEIEKARATCSGGNEAGALSQLRATKSKFGYP